ncbi:MAG: acylneuraminate cytidylyltransferase family protein [Luteitalea sp.]|nr:acylneuraminate cytidylyltransferase family protein [Luteitalea sp.]
MRTLILIPARGQSKGIPRKNLRPLGGRPLLAYTAATALAVRRATRRVLSTDDAEIAEVGRECGLEVPFMRPPELALDDTPTLPVVQHAVAWLETRGEGVDAICLLQPTSPFRRAEDVDSCIELLETSGADAVVTVVPVPARHNPHWVYFRDDEGRLRLSTGESQPVTRRQDLPAAFHRDGSVYVVRRDVLMKQNSLYGSRLLSVVVDPDATVDIDTMDDLERAERVLAQSAGQA